MKKKSTQIGIYHVTDEKFCPTYWFIHSYPFIREIRAAKPGKVCKTLETMSVPTFSALSTKACKTALTKSQT